MAEEEEDVGSYEGESFFAEMGELEEFDEEYDPLAVDDTEINPDEVDDDNPYDTVDYPVMREIPEAYKAKMDLYTPEKQGSPSEAMLSLFDHNPRLRPILLAIIGWCDGGCLNSVLTERVEAMKKNNQCVYSTTTLCHMLERAGGLELEMPETSEEHEDVEEGVEYLEIKEHVDPIWHATEDAIAVREGETSGAQFREIIMDKDKKYIDVYVMVLEAFEEKPHQIKEISALVDDLPIVQKPRRWAGHFIDMLEKVDAIEWKNRIWQITDLGRQMLPVAKEFAAQEAAAAAEAAAQEAAEAAAEAEGDAAAAAKAEAAEDEAAAGEAGDAAVAAAAAADAAATDEAVEPEAEADAEPAADDAAEEDTTEAKEE